MKETVLISGATGGIGSACARRFAADGYPVAILFHTDAVAAEALVQEITNNGGRASVYQGDVAAREHVTDAVTQAKQQLGPIGTIIHAATAPLQSVSIADASWEKYQEHLEVSLHGALNLVQAGTPGMVARTHGNIVFFLTAALEHPPAGWSAYLAAKAALGQYARSVEHELGKAGVRVHTIAPGFVDTPLTAGLPDVFKRIAREQPGASTPEAVAEQVLQLVAQT